MLKKIYIGIGATVCLWFVTAAIAGWKSPSFFKGSRGAGPGPGGYSGGRGSGYYGGGWSGGK